MIPTAGLPTEVAQAIHQAEAATNAKLNWEFGGEPGLGGTGEGEEKKLPVCTR
ncbi:hypothetical protein D3C83_227360 [compost metagenome]